MFDISIKNIDGLFNDMLNDLSSNFKNFENKDKEKDKNKDKDKEKDKNKDKDKDKDKDQSDNKDYAIPDKEELFSHINKLINGKIGSLAKEIAEETTKDIEMENVGDINDVNDILKGFMKNPTKLLSLINNINNKISSKMKDGSLKESELLEEAAGIFKNMKNIPGMENFNDILKSMNMDKFMPKGGKINPNAFQNMMEQNVKMSKMRERMKKKAENGNQRDNATRDNATRDNATRDNATSDNIKLDDLTTNLSSLMNEMNNNTSFIDSIIKNQNTNKQASSRNNEENSKRRDNNKKKVNRKK